MNLKSLQLLRGNDSSNLARLFSNNPSAIVASVLTVTAATVCCLPQQAAAIDLNFSTCTGTSSFTDIDGSPAFAGNILSCTNVAPGVDARITATLFGNNNYSFGGHIPNYYYTNTTPSQQPQDDLASLYQIATNQTGFGGIDYKIDLFQGGGTFSTAYTASSLNFLMYDVDGENDGSGNVVQTEAVRISKNSGLVGYKVGTTPQALSFSQDATSYLFSGQNENVLETDPSGMAIFYFQNVSSVNFRLEADTRIAQAFPNEVFTSIDGDLSLLNALPRGSFTSVTAVPEPFTIIGTIVGGTAALRLRKKLKSDRK